MGATLNKPVTTAVLESHANKNFRVGMAEMNGWRTNMEDAHVVHFSPSGDAYFGVLDGHGGSACSEWCAKQLHERLEANGIPANDAAAKKMILEIDQAFLDTGSPRKKDPDSYGLHVMVFMFTAMVFSKLSASNLSNLSVVFIIFNNLFYDIVSLLCYTRVYAYIFFLKILNSEPDRASERVDRGDVLGAAAGEARREVQAARDQRRRQPRAALSPRPPMAPTRLVHR